MEQIMLAYRSYGIEIGGTNFQNQSLPKQDFIS